MSRKIDRTAQIFYEFLKLKLQKISHIILSFYLIIYNFIIIFRDERVLKKMIRNSTRKSNTKRPRKNPKSASLEFSECWLDPPRFRNSVQVYEKEIEGTHKAIKNLVKNIGVNIKKL